MKIENATHFAMRAMVPNFNSPEAVCSCGTRASFRAGTDQWFCSTHKPTQQNQRVHTQRDSRNVKASSPAIERASTFAQRLVHVPVFGESHGNCPCGDKSAYRYQFGRTEFLFCARHRPAAHADPQQHTEQIIREQVARLTACPCGASGTEQRFADARRVPFWFCRAHVPEAGVDVRMHSSSLVRQRLEQLIHRR